MLQVQIAFGNVPEVEEDFGQTLAVWGVPDGPYVMLPIFGPSSVRDAVGLGVDTVTNPSIICLQNE